MPERHTAELVDELLAGSPELGRTDALLVRRGGELAPERYGDGIGPDDTLRSWSMATSLLHAAVGMLVAEGRLSLHDPAPVAEWSSPGDQRGAITSWDLLTLRSGLTWVEDPAPGGGRSDVVEMLRGADGAPQHDTGAFAATMPLRDPPGGVTQYSSGNSAIVADVVGRGEPYLDHLRSQLFEPLGMHRATPKLDPSGVSMASSFCCCTTREFASFGQLYLDRGVRDGRRLLPEDRVDTAATVTGVDPQGRAHTCHWWRFGDGRWGAFHASGWLGQYVVVVPELELVLVRLGETHGVRRPLEAHLGELLATFDTDRRAP